MSRLHWSRREFLRHLGLGSAVVVSSASGISVWGPAASALTGTERATRSNGRTLVVVELAGGNDGLNTVVPLDDGAYRDLRPTLAIADALDLDGSVGLHPSLPRLGARYATGEVAILEGLGYPDPDLSHFGSIAIWWTARGGSGSGWLGAYLDGAVGFDDPLAAIGIGPTPSPALLGRASFATTIADASGLQPRLPSWLGDPDSLLKRWKATGATEDGSTLTGQVGRAIDLTVEARRLLTDVLASADTSSDSTSPAGRRAYQDRSVVDSLALAARIVASPVRPRVVYISGIGDYDTHQGQAAQHATLLSELDEGIETFFAQIGNRARDVVLMTTSEFGRRPAENGSGTDHGTANVHLVIGPAVRGGRYGERPSLTDLDRTRNLRHTSDFRSLYATVLDGWLDADAAEVLGGRHETFDVF